MENLKEIGINEDIIKKMVDSNTYSLVEDLDFNSENVLEIINYLKQNDINENTINDLLINSIDLFFIDAPIVIDILNTSDFKELINEINKDYTIILDLLY